MKRWAHGHTLGAGAIIGIGLASQHVWVLCLLVFLAGIMTGRFWALIHHAAEALRLKVLHAKAERIRTRPEPVYSTRRGRSDRIPF